VERGRLLEVVAAVKNGPADEFDAERSEILTTGSTEDTGESWK